MIAICNIPNILNTSIESNVLNKQNCCALNQAELKSPHPLNNGGEEVGTQISTGHPSLCRTQGTCQQPPCRLSMMEESQQHWITADCERRGLRSRTLSFLNPKINSQITDESRRYAALTRHFVSFLRHTLKPVRCPLNPMATRAHLF